MSRSQSLLFLVSEQDLRPNAPHGLAALPEALQAGGLLWLALMLPRVILPPLRVGAFASMKLRSSIVALAAVVVLADRAPAQAATDASNPVGVWRGTSTCLVRPSPCRNEVAVYRITRIGATDSVSIDARKIVNAREEEMGILACRLTARGGAITCTMKNGVWRFTVRRDSLVGELRLPDDTKFRDVRTARVHERSR